MKKILILLLCLSMLLAGCQSNDVQTETESEQVTNSETQADDKNITAVSEGKALLKICCTTYASLDSAENMQKLLQKKITLYLK